MKIYLAAPYIAREQVRRCADELRFMRFEVTSRWLDESGDIEPSVLGAASGRTIEEARGHVRTDFADIDRADIIVVFTASTTAFMLGRETPATSPALHSGGRHVELGYALAKRKRAIVLGPDENIFHRGATFATCLTWHSAVMELVNLRETARIGCKS